MSEMQHVHLQVLNLDFCTLSELPASLGQLTALTTLDVEGNPYLGETFRPDSMAMPPAFPAELSGLQALKYINLNSCGLTSVPEVGFHIWIVYPVRTATGLSLQPVDSALVYALTGNCGTGQSSS